MRGYRTVRWIILLTVMMTLATGGQALASDPPPIPPSVTVGGLESHEIGVKYADEFALMYQLYKIAVTTNDSNQAASALANYGVGKLASLNPTTAWIYWAAQTGEYAANRMNAWHVQEALNYYMAARRGRAKYFGLDITDGSDDVKQYLNGNVVTGLAELFASGIGRDPNLDKYIKAVVKGDVNYSGTLTKSDYLKGFAALEVGYKFHLATEEAQKESDSSPEDAPQGASKDETLPDGTLHYVYDDGTEVYIKPDGTYIRHNPDGSSDVVQPDGTHFIIPPSSTLYDNADTGSTQNLPTHNNANPDDNASASTGVIREESCYNAWLRLAIAKNNATAIELLTYRYPEWSDEVLADYRNFITNAEAWYQAYRGARYFYEDALNIVGNLEPEELESGETVEISLDVPDPVLSRPITYRPLSRAGLVKMAQQDPAGFAAVTALPLAQVRAMRSVPDVAVLRRGFYREAVALLSELGEPATLVDEFTGAEELAEFPVLVIPTAALSGMDSAWFREKLEEYVEEGGTVICFTQQRGADFRALPGGMVDGYGYDEDELCQYASAYFGEYRSILAGQTKATPDFNVDGFFSSYPENAIILLNRVKNQQSVALLYDYGKGYVIASTLYSDWARANYQVTSDDRTWLRDALAWTKFPKARSNEHKNGDTVVVNVAVKNWSLENATRVEFKIISPSGNEMPAEYLTNVVQELNNLEPGEETVVTLEYRIPQDNSAYGFYRVDYALENTEGEVIQKSFSKAAFVVSRFKTNPEGFSYRESEISASVTSTSEMYYKSGTGEFTVTVYNDSQEIREVRVDYIFYHHFWDWIPGYKRNDEKWRGRQTLTVPAGGEASFEVEATDLQVNDALTVNVYEGNELVARARRGFFVERIPVSASGSLDKGEYEPGEPLRLTVNLRCGLERDLPAEIYIRGSYYGKPLYEKEVTLHADPKGSDNTLILEPSLRRGNYYLDVYIKGREAVRGLTFSVSEELFFSAQLASADNTFSAGEKVPVEVTVENTGDFTYNGYIAAGVSGVSAAATSQALQVGAGETISVTLEVPLPQNMWSGQYDLQVDFTAEGGYEFSWEEEIYLPEAKLTLETPETALVAAGETVVVPISNEGGGRSGFVSWKMVLEDQEGEVLAKNSGITVLNAGETDSLTLQVPPDIKSGRYLLKVSTARDSAVHAFNIEGAASALVLDLEEYYSESSTEPMEITAEVSNTSSVELTDASLSISVQRAGEQQKTGSAVQEKAVRAALAADYNVLYVLQDGSGGPQVRRYSISEGEECLDMGIDWTRELVAADETVSAYVYQLAGDKDYLYGLTVNGGGNTRLHVLSAAGGQRLASATLNSVNNPAGLGLAGGYLFVLEDNASGRDYIYGFPAAGISDGDVLEALMEKEVETPNNEPYENLMLAGDGENLYQLYYMPYENRYKILPYEVTPGGGPQLTAGTVMALNGELITHPLEGFSAIRGGGFNLWASEWSSIRLDGAGNYDYGLSLGYGYLPLAAVSAFDPGGSEYRTVVYQLPEDDPYNPGQYALFLDVIPPEGLPLEEPVFQDEIPVNLAAGETMQQVFDIGKSPADMGAGSYEVFASLEMSTGRKLAGAYKTFTVAPAGGYVTLSTDTGYCRAGDEVLAQVDVYNPSSQEQEITVELRTDEEVIDRRTVAVSGGKQVSYTVEVTAPPESFTLKAVCETMAAYKDIEVVQPELAAALLAPTAYALGQDFQLEAVVQNRGRVAFSGMVELIRRYTESPSSSPVTVYSTGISLDPGETWKQSIKDAIVSGNSSWQYLLLVKEDEEVITQSQVRNVAAGNDITLTADIDTGYYPDDVSFPVYVTNAGSLPVTDMTLTVTLAGEAGDAESITFEVPVVRERNEGVDGQVKLTAYFEELEPGTYTVTATSPYLAGGVNLGILEVLPLEPQWEIEVLTSPEVTAGQEATVPFAVYNAGLVPGEISITPYFPGGGCGAPVTADVSAGESVNVDVSFMVPEDLPAGETIFRFLAGKELIRVPLTVNGLDIAVNAALDREWYAEGDTAVLTITVDNNSSFDATLFARVELDDYTDIAEFNLAAAGTASVSLDIPVTENAAGEKLMFGIYHESGRSLYLNSYYLPLEGDVISLKADKQVYQMGETGKIIIRAAQDGILNITRPNHAWVSIPEGEIEIAAGEKEINFSVPVEEKTGSYSVQYTFTVGEEEIKRVFYIDVSGYKLTVQEADLDKSSYDADDTAELELVLTSERDIDKTVEVYWYLLDEKGKVVRKGTESVASGLEAGSSALKITLDLTALPEGSYILRYSVSADLEGHSPVVLTSGSTVLTVFDETPPTVVETLPADGETGVDPETVIMITFDEAVKTETVEKGWQLSGGISGTFSWPKADEAIFTPDKVLPEGLYTVELTGVEDSAGNVMEVYSFSFRVGEASSKGSNNADKAETVTTLGSEDEHTVFISPEGKAEVTVDEASIRKLINEGYRNFLVRWEKDSGMAVFTEETVEAVSAIGGSVGILAGNVRLAVPASSLSEGDVAVTVKPLDDTAAEKLMARVKVLNPGADKVSKIYEINITGESREKAKDVRLFIGSGLPAGDDPDTCFVTLINDDGRLMVAPVNEIIYDEEKNVSGFAAELPHLSKYAVVKFDNPFKDISDHWAKRDILLMAAKKVVKGMEAERFAPQSPVTRAQFAVLLTRILGIEEYTGEDATFIDLSSSHWSFGAVEAAYRLGLVKGTGAGRFSPEREITRQEMAVMTARALKHAGVGADLNAGEIETILENFKDSSDIAEWAREGAALCRKKGIILGRTTRQFAPLAETTRAESVVILKRMLVAAEIL